MISLYLCISYYLTKMHCNLSSILGSHFSPLTHLLTDFSHCVLQTFKSFSYTVLLQSRLHLKAVLREARENFRPFLSRVKNVLSSFFISVLMGVEEEVRLLV